MNIKPLLLALAIGVVPMASDAKDWSKEPLVAVQQAAKQGNADAQLTLGMMYSGGIEVAQDDKQAVAWYRKAAEQGDASAQYKLGVMYEQGKGVAQDYKLAYVWSSVSAANGYAYAATNRDLFAKRLSPAVLAEAQALAGQYVELYQPKQ